MREKVIFEAILNEDGILCIRIPGLDPAVIGRKCATWVVDHPVSHFPADMGRRFWKRVIHVFKQECNIRGGSERQLLRAAIIREKIELVEKGLHRGTSLFPRRRS